MNVKQLKELVNSIPDSLNDRIVILQKDQEGNGFHEVRGIDSIECYWFDEEEVKSPNQYDKDEWNEIMKEEPEPCIVLYP